MAIAVNLLAIALIVRFRPLSAPIGERMPMSERWVAIKAAGPFILLMVAVFGGLYSGIFTVTEAASVAACYRSCSPWREAGSIGRPYFRVCGNPQPPPA